VDVGVDVVVSECESKSKSKSKSVVESERERESGNMGWAGKIKHSSPTRNTKGVACAVCLLAKKLKGGFLGSRKLSSEAKTFFLATRMHTL
jgi:hypothetical protein